MTMCKFVLLLLARSRPLVLIGEKKKRGGEKEEPRGKVQYPSFSCAAGDVASPPPSFAVRQKEEEGRKEAPSPKHISLFLQVVDSLPLPLFVQGKKGGSDEKGRALFFLFFLQTHAPEPQTTNKGGGTVEFCLRLPLPSFT